MNLEERVLLKLWTRPLSVLPYSAAIHAGVSLPAVFGTVALAYVTMPAVGWYPKWLLLAIARWSERLDPHSGRGRQLTAEWGAHMRPCRPGRR